MLTIFKKLFGKATPAPVAAIPAAPLAPAAPMPTIEVAHLSLGAITARFPDDLKPLLANEPDSAATVALPLPTILKQLPNGCVKMSLASLQRQAHGAIKPIAQGDKRMVSVPLDEVLRHLQPSAYRRRPDQRTAYVPDNGYSLFGDSTNPYAIAAEDETQPQILDLSKELAPEISDELPPEEPPAPVESPRVLKMDDGLREHFNNASASQSASAPAASPSELKFEETASAPSTTAAPAAEPIAKPEGPTLDLPIAPLAAAWPEEIRAEIEALDPATVVTLPLTDIGASLAKGRVTFTWGQIRAWLEPASEASSSSPDAAVLLLPLKIVAPAYLATTKSAKPERKTVTMDASIPALFSDARTAEPAPQPDPPAPAVGAAPEAAATPKNPETIGDVFGQPQKRDWTPTELVAGLVQLPGVAGAIVALQEGLPVAASLPDGVKSEVVAAFLPQIFARLNQYSGEMKLGEVDDMLFTTHGAHCQIYRLGYVYLAVLGKPGESLPWTELRLISGELARQTQQ